MISYHIPIQPKFKYVVTSRADDKAIDNKVIATFDTAKEALACCATLHDCYVSQIPV